MFPIITIFNRLILLSSIFLLSLSSVSGTAFANECIDPDGDGWGWNGVESCLVSSSTFAGECIDTDGDGWGWNGIESCFIDRGSVSTETVSTEARPLSSITPPLPHFGGGADESNSNQFRHLVPLPSDPRFEIYSDLDESDIEDFERYVHDFVTLDPDANTTLNQIFETNGPVILDKTYSKYSTTIINGWGIGERYRVNLGKNFFNGQFNVQGSSDYGNISVGSIAFHELTHVTTLYATGYDTKDKVRNLFVEQSISESIDKLVRALEISDVQAKEDAIEKINNNYLLAIEEVTVARTNELYRLAKGEDFRGPYLRAFDPRGLSEQEIQERKELLNLIFNSNVVQSNPTLIAKFRNALALAGITTVTDPATRDSNIQSSASARVMVRDFFNGIEEEDVKRIAIEGEFGGSPTDTNAVPIRRNSSQGPRVVSTRTWTEERRDGRDTYTLETYSNGQKATFFGSSNTSTDGQFIRGGNSTNSKGNGGADHTPWGGGNNMPGRQSAEEGGWGTSPGGEFG